MEKASLSEQETTLPIDWVESLKTFVASKKQRLPEEIEKETDELFLGIMQKMKKKQESQDTSYMRIPKFLKKLNHNENSLGFKIREEVRARFLNHKAIELLDQQGSVRWRFLFCRPREDLPPAQIEYLAAV